jgi:hypothetical protein
MRKPLQILIPLAFVALGVAAFVVWLNDDPSRLSRTLFSCVYTASGFAALAALEGAKGRTVAFMEPFGVVFSGYQPNEAVILATFLSVRALYRALVGSDGEARAVNCELPPGSGCLVKSTDGQYFQLLRGPDQLSLIHLGASGPLSTATRPIRPEEAFVPRGWDRSIPLDRLRSIRVRLDGSLRIRAPRGGLFFPQSPTTADDVAEYLAGLPLVIVPLPRQRLSEAGTRTLHTFFTRSPI